MYDYLIMEDGSVIYPSYLDKEERQELRNRMGEKTEYMYCSCSLKEKLYYRISVDLKIIPCHQNYEHQEGCCRGGGKLRYSSFVKSDEGTTATAFLKFNPAKFTVSFASEDTDVSDDEEELETDDDNNLPKVSDRRETLPGEYKEPYSSLSTFVKQINYDTYMERLIKGKKTLASNDYFISALYGHLQNVKISPMKKSVKDLDLKKDGYKFFYAPLVAYECTEEESSITLKYFDKEYKYFMFPGNMRNALKQYKKFYGEYPDLESGHVMAAGFIYQRISKYKKPYKTPGRIVLFDVSKQGIFCVNDVFRESYNTIFDCLYQLYLWNKVKVYLSVDEPNVICTIRSDNNSRYLKVYYDKTEEEMEDENCIAIECNKMALEYRIIEKHITDMQKEIDN